MNLDRFIKTINEEFDDSGADPELIEHVKFQIEDCLNKKPSEEIEEELKSMLKRISETKVRSISHKELLEMLNRVDKIRLMKIPSYRDTDFEI